MRALALYVLFFVSNVSFALDIEYSQKFFDPERSGESQWTRIDSLKNPSIQLDLGSIKVASADSRYFFLRVVNDSSSIQQLSWSGLPQGFRWKNEPPTSLAANQKVVLELELLSEGVGKKFVELSAKVNGESAPHLLRVLFEVKE
ncbi:MAG: hypothetical protein R3A80_07035 [Bdellovibrionota bacterium]